MTSQTKGGLEVNIMGRQFRIACAQHEQKELLRAIEYVDNKMREIRDAGKVIGVERIAIMAALNITHDYLSTRVEGGFAVGDFKRRLLDMQTAIDQAINAQDELF
jgi:cell division protein ZapA